MQRLTTDGRTRLLRVVANPQNATREVYHVGIEDTPDTVVAHAIHFASSAQDPRTSLDGFDTGPCEHMQSGFAVPRKIGLAPLRIDYDVEPPFEQWDITHQERSSGDCIATERAVWRSRKGFEIMSDSRACSTRFRAVHVRPDGSLDVRPLPRR